MDPNELDMSVPAEPVDAGALFPPSMGLQGGEYIDLSPFAAASLELTTSTLNLLPVLGEAKGYLEAWTGKDTLTDKELSTFERALDLLPLLGHAIHTTAHIVLGMKIAEDVTVAEKVIGAADKLEAVREELKATQEAANELLTAGHLQNDLKLLDEGVRHALEAMKLGEEVNNPLLIAKIAEVIEHAHTAYHVSEAARALVEFFASTNEGHETASHQTTEISRELDGHPSPSEEDAKQAVEKHFVLDPFVLHASQGHAGHHHGGHHASRHGEGLEAGREHTGGTHHGHESVDKNNISGLPEIHLTTHEHARFDHMILPLTDMHHTGGLHIHDQLVAHAPTFDTAGLHIADHLAPITDLAHPSHSPDFSAFTHLGSDHAHATSHGSPGLNDASFVHHAGDTGNHGGFAGDGAMFIPPHDGNHHF